MSILVGYPTAIQIKTKRSEVVLVELLIITHFVAI